MSLFVYYCLMHLIHVAEMQRLSNRLQLVEIMRPGEPDSINHLEAGTYIAECIWY